MKSWTLQKSTCSGSIKIPPSKSHTLRAVLFALMAEGTSTIHNYLPSPDTDAMVRAVQALGAKVTKTAHTMEVVGCGGKLQTPDDVIDSANSGLVLRFIGALAALLPTYTVITGDHSIRHSRPALPLLESLQQLGAFASSLRLDGRAPLILKGPIQPGFLELEGQDSQPVSALLIACSFMQGRSTIHVKNPGEKPWIDLTLYWLDKLGIRYEAKNYETYTLYGSASYKGFTVTIPSDFSSASFPIAAALITNSELTLEGIDMDDVQGDKKLIDTFIEMGAHITYDKKEQTLTVKKGSSLKGKEIDINDYIDAIAILGVIGCFAEGETKITNAAIARHKESDRIRCIVTELKKMGADIEESKEGFVVRKSALKGAKVHSHKDHRIAMSLAIAGLGASGTTHITDVGCVSKTYPTFDYDFEQVGCSIKEDS